MNRRMICRTSVAVVLLISAAALLSGCLESEKTIEGTYDAGSDSFRYLVVYQQIRSSEMQPATAEAPAPDPTVKPMEGAAPDGVASDLARLRALYDNRDHLILLPTGSPSPLEDFGESALIRLTKDSAKWVSLSKDEKWPGDALHAAAPLDAIQITPGALFLRTPDNLCYYHQVTIPGKWLDAALPIASKAYFDANGEEMIEQINVEQTRRKNGGARMKWSDATARVVSQIKEKMTFSKDAPPEPATSEPAGLPRMDIVTTQPAGDDNDSEQITMPFSDDSLAWLKTSIQNKSMVVTRQGSRFSLRITLTNDDLSGLLALATQARAAVKAQADAAPANDAESQRLAKSVIKALDAISISGPDEGTLRVTVDAIKAFDIFGKPTEPLRERTPDDLKAASGFAHYAAQRGLPIDQNVKLEKLVEQFHANTLKGNPSADLVTPGTDLDLNPPQPTTAPLEK